ncbi:MAG: Holliday junction branch migration protein RuvA [Syntrophobacterales bacterium]|jgi:Holliday junction DNA helicase RuvA|nr:Holliday junction branch migration protein RuvA [Syntrophobacterales bacterium]
MIARIDGLLIEKTPACIIVEAMGIGYEIIVPLTTFYELPEINQKVVLKIHTHIREDAMTLFGFLTQKEKDVFQLLITVTGIGPKLAINIISGTDFSDLVSSIAHGDLDRLVRIPGVGRKTAERIIFDLRDKKIIGLSTEWGEEASGVSEDTRLIKEDALSALVNLGYKQQRISDVLDQVLRDTEAENASLDIILKKSLKILAK